MSYLSSNDDIDFDAAASAFPDISLDGSGDIPAMPTMAHTSSGFSFDDFDTPAEPVKVTGDDEIEKFENEFPEIDVAPVASPPSLFGATIAPRPQPSAFTSTPILSQPLEEEEPEVIKEWRKKQADEIAAREAAAATRKEETIKAAENALDDFYADLNRKKERNILENKKNEEDYLQSMTDSLSAGTTWERICDLIELQNSQSKTLARTGAGTTDLTRMKEVLLRLKREGDAAPGAGGY
ncbi:clathrin light chain-domain-containing protein [Mycena floridula]|nr:clathrin light chain-domain-containing protein [Mycena floridula]